MPFRTPFRATYKVIIAKNAERVKQAYFSDVAVTAASSREKYRAIISSSLSSESPPFCGIKVKTAFEGERLQ